jgi:hypothetical protein
MSDTEAPWLDLDGAARFLSVKPDAMRRLVRLGRIPEPNYELGPHSPRWSRDLLDKKMRGTVNGAVGGTSSTNATEASQAGVNKILEAARRSRR